MTSSRRRNSKNSFDRSNLDRRMDQFLEVGRQFVDGVSGTRPGKRKPSSLSQFSRQNVKNVGQWVTNKMDTFFEDAEEERDDWYYEDDYEESDDFKSFSRTNKTRRDLTVQKKRPLQAISLRDSQKKEFLEQKKLPYQIDSSEDEWPDNSDFQVNKWQRNTEQNKEFIQEKKLEGSIDSRGRNLPRSRRRRT